MFKKKRDKPISFRVTKEFNVLIDILSEKLMISKTAVFTIAITELAKREGVLDREETEFDMEELAAEVGKQFQADLTPIADALVTMVTDLKEMAERLDKLEETKQSSMNNPAKGEAHRLFEQSVG
jgi:thymidine phosphorylase